MITTARDPSVDLTTESIALCERLIDAIDGSPTAVTIYALVDALAIVLARQVDTDGLLDIAIEHLRKATTVMSATLGPVAQGNA